MKKSFVYLIMVLLLVSMLTGCGKAKDDGTMVTVAPTSAPTIAPTSMPETIPSTSPDMNGGTETDKNITDGVASPENGGSTTASPTASASTSA